MPDPYPPPPPPPPWVEVKPGGGRKEIRYYLIMGPASSVRSYYFTSNDPAAEAWLAYAKMLVAKIVPVGLTKIVADTSDYIDTRAVGYPDYTKLTVYRCYRIKSMGIRIKKIK